MTAKILASIIAVMVFYGSYEFVKLQAQKGENKKIKEQIYSEEKIQSAINHYADLFEKFPGSLGELVELGLLDEYDLLTKATKEKSAIQNINELSKKCEEAIKSYQKDYGQLPPDNSLVPECNTLLSIPVMYLNGMELETNISSEYLTKIKTMRAYKNPLYDVNESLYKYVRLTPEVNRKVVKTLKTQIKQKFLNDVESNNTLLELIDINGTTSIIALDGILKLLDDSDLSKESKLVLLGVMDKVIESDIVYIKEKLLNEQNLTKKSVDNMANFLDILRSR